MATLFALAGSVGAGLATTTGGALSGLGSAVMLDAALLSGVGMISSGRAQQKAAEFNAAQQEAQGETEFALATARAEEQARQNRITQSRARAVAASGGGGLDLELIGDLEEEGQYNTLSAVWEGQESKKGRRAAGAASRFEGAQARTASLIQGAGTILSGGGRTLLEKYG